MYVLITRCLSNGNNFATLAALAEVCAVLNAILVIYFIRTENKHFTVFTQYNLYLIKIA